MHHRARRPGHLPRRQQRGGDLLTARVLALLLATGIAGCGASGRPAATTGGAATPQPGETNASPEAQQAEANARTAEEGASANGTQRDAQINGETPTTPGSETITVPRRPKPTAPSSGAARPKIVWRRIPFPASRKAEMRAYAERHYGIWTYRLIHPHVLVEHYTANSSFDATYNTFAPDRPDIELHELPGVCSHFVVDRDGTIYQLVSLHVMCRHTVGLNYTAIGVENVGTSAASVTGNPPQFAASIRLANYLRCRYGIALRNVIGHNESLGSPFHHENVASLRTQTHADFSTAEMAPFRRALARLRC